MKHAFSFHLWQFLDLTITNETVGIAYLVLFWHAGPAKQAIQHHKAGILTSTTPDFLKERERERERERETGDSVEKSEASRSSGAVSYA